jgi:hypothetical protein
MNLLNQSRDLPAALPEPRYERIDVLLDQVLRDVMDLLDRIGTVIDTRMASSDEDET